ncbi:MAG: sensor histidine kinase, partial [Peptostreptococcaceae bacterium]
IREYGSYHDDIHIDPLNKKIDISIQIFEKNNEKYRVLRFHDITKRYELEKSFLELENIKKEENMKNEFFANISHELKTPLNIIYSTVQLLTFSYEKENFKDLCLKYKNSLDINCKRMLRLIDNIVDITKLEVGFKVPEFYNYDIVRLIEGITMSIINYAKIKDIKVIFDTDVEELYIKCDPDMIERIMLNLLSNSIKFTNVGGTIFVDIKSDNQLVNISVKDDGIGIPIEIQSKIFDRFVQNDKTLIRENEGSGIGLSIVKSLVELMGGKIYLESDGKNGSEFIISLPNDKLDIHDDKLDCKEYDIDVHKIQLEFSDIYELYNI